MFNKLKKNTSKKPDSNRTVWIYRDEQGREFEVDPVNGVPPFIIENSEPLLKNGPIPSLPGKIIYDRKFNEITTPDGGIFGKGPSVVELRSLRALHFGERLGFKARISSDIYPLGGNASAGCDGRVELMKQPEKFTTQDLMEFIQFLATGFCAEYLSLGHRYLRDHSEHTPNSGLIPLEKFMAVNLSLIADSVDKNALIGET